MFQGTMNGIRAFVILLMVIGGASFKPDYQTEDIFIPSECESIASTGDHLLINYTVYFSNGTVCTTLPKTSQLLHVMLTTQDDLPVINTMKGMCLSSTRRITWDSSQKVNTQPIYVDVALGLSSRTDGVYIDLTIEHITTHDEYQMFSALRSANYSQVLDLIENHVGVNAVDEWGQTPLMVAVQTNRVDIVAALLNTRLPKVDINAAKPSGYTALFYAIERASPSIVSALLRRGADPNVALLHEGSKGTTPLHFACMFEKTKSAELLLEYGARPDAKNEHGQVPLQLLPADAVRSSKLFFKKMFEEAIAKARDAAGSNSELPPFEPDRFDL